MWCIMAIAYGFEDCFEAFGFATSTPSSHLSPSLSSLLSFFSRAYTPLPHSGFVSFTVFYAAKGEQGGNGDGKATPQAKETLPLPSSVSSSLSSLLSLFLSIDIPLLSPLYSSLLHSTEKKNHHLFFLFHACSFLPLCVVTIPPIKPRPLSPVLLPS